MPKDPKDIKDPKENKDQGNNQETEQGQENSTDNEQSQPKGGDEKEKPNEYLSKLRERAEKLGLDSIKVQKAGFDELTQMIEDKRVDQAIKTRDEKIKKQQEEEEMKKKGEWEKIALKERKEHLNDYVEAKLGENLSDFKDLINVDSLLGVEKSEAKEKIDKTISSLNELIQKQVEENYTAKVKELETDTSPKNQNSAKSDNPLDMLNDLMGNSKK